MQVLGVDPLDARAVMSSERSALLDLLDELDAKEWDRATACPPWTVHDLVAHVLASDLGLLSRVRDREKRGWIDSSGGELVDLLAARNQQWVDACAPLSGGVLRDLLRATGVAVDSWAASTDLRALGEGVSWAGLDAAPIWLCLAREYTERWVHQQQVRAALRRPGLVDEAHLGPVLDTFKWAIPIALADTPGTLHVNLTGTAPRSWLVDHVGFHDAGAPDATVTITTETFVRQCTAPSDRTAGNGSLVDAFTRARAIIV